MIKLPPLTPETLLILPLAVGIDLASVILVCFALDDFGILDIVGTTFIGTWLFFKKGKMPKKGGNPIRKIFTGKYTKFLTPIFGEIIPYLGVLPFWSASVYFQLTE